MKIQLIIEDELDCSLTEFFNVTKDGIFTYNSKEYGIRSMSVSKTVENRIEGMLTLVKKN